MANKVKCADCGLIGLRLKQTRVLIEAEYELRTKGRLPGTRFAGAQSPADDYPCCYAGIANFHDEMGDSPIDSYRQHAANRERECSEFVKWHVGLSPKEHIDMLALKEQREWQQRKDSEDKRWRVIELIVMGAIVTAVSVAAQIGSAFIERGSLFPTNQAQPTIQVVMPPQPAIPDVAH